jgi:hypothetical protein
MVWAKVRWISTTGFEENLWGAYGGGAGANGSKGRAQHGWWRARVGKGTHTTGKGGAHGLWEGRTRVGMGARTTVAFTNFRV